MLPYIIRTWRSNNSDGVCDLRGHHEGLQCSSLRGLQTWDPGPGEVTRASRPGEVSQYTFLFLISNIFVRTKIRMIALCPCLVDTPLSRAAMNVGKDQKFSSEMGMRALQSSEVAEAFERLVVSGGTGEALLVYPGLTFYWPNVQFWMFNIYCYISKFLIMVRDFPTLHFIVL